MWCISGCGAALRRARAVCACVHARCVGEGRRRRRYRCRGAWCEFVASSSSSVRDAGGARAKASSGRQDCAPAREIVGGVVGACRRVDGDVRDVSEERGVEAVVVVRAHATKRGRGGVFGERREAREGGGGGERGGGNALRGGGERGGER